jgi:hypothetical protein
MNVVSTEGRGAYLGSARSSRPSREGELGESRPLGCSRSSAMTTCGFAILLLEENRPIRLDTTSNIAELLC